MEDQRLAVHRTIVVVDVEGFGDQRRTNAHQVAVRDGLYRVMREAFGRAGISWGDCGREDRGDGVFVLVPAEVPKSLLAESLPLALVTALRAHNTAHPAPERIRLRMALHAGEVQYDEHGVTAASINLAFRLLDAGALKAALGGSPGVLAVIVSSWFFEEVMRHSGAAAGYRQVEVAVKETTTIGWICLPDHLDPAGRAMPQFLPAVPAVPPVQPTAAVRTLARDTGAFTGRARERDRRAAAVRARAPGGESAAGGVHGFAPALTSFVGRTGAVRDVAGLLEQYRLVTVTGPGGAGKTRLAGEVAGRVADRFADGVWLAELAAVRDPALVASVVAAALEVRDLPGVSAAEALARVLARRQLLLVLDNCEHVIGAAAELCAGLLLACDDVRVLATSREPLAVAGEARYRLGALAVPGPDDAADAAGCEAVALFADRAHRADAGFALDGETGSAVARLVARLDGMPLAIELAAARVEALGVTELLDRIDDRFGLLVAGDRLAAGRQRSLAATVEWSYRLLNDHERRVFRAVSVFPGPFTLRAAEAVAVGDDAGLAVLRLVDCSLLVPPRAGPDGRSRYVMLDTLRAYGAALLAEAGEDDGAAAALAGYALGVAQQAAAGRGTSTAEVAAARRLDAEDATMRQVLAWATQHDAAMALRLAVALEWWWFLRGRLASGYPLLRQAADRAAPGSAGWCAAQVWLGWTGLYSADLVGALGHFTALCDAIGDRPLSRALADGLCGRSVALSNLGRFVEAAEEGRRSLALAREVGYPVGEAMALAGLSIAAYMAGDPGSAVLLARQSQQVKADIPSSIARACSSTLIDALTETGDLAAAEHICAAGLALSRDAGDLWNQASLLTKTTILDLQEGRVEDASAHLREALQINLRAGSWTDVLTGLDCCGYLCAATRRPAEAVTAWAACVALSLHEGFTEAPAAARRRQEPLRKARQALGSARARAAEERGTAMSRDTVAEYALMLTAAGPQQPQVALGLGKLSARERELITLVAQGRTNAQIAAQLDISVRTVRSHLDRIRDKTDCRRRADLTPLALSAGLV
jgi:predicted ATPase/DNA-binding CsgD family transcriptional regulator